jgi:FixJ family two-component response regulator
MTVFVVENDKSLRLGIESLLGSVGYRVKGFDSAELFLRERDRQQMGCLVLDVRLSGISGLELQKRLIIGGDRIPTIFISANGDIPMCAQAMKSGALDFLPKPFREQDLLEIVQTALNGELARQTHDQELSAALGNYKSLTKREREILKLVVTGQINKRIAAQLEVSEVTVKIHRGKVMEKMNADSLADLVRFFDSIEPFLGSEISGSSFAQ